MEFKVWRWIDALTLGLPALIAAGFIAGAWATPGNSAVGIGVTAATALGFVAIYAMVLLRRWQFRERIAFTTSQGIHVLKSDFPVIRVHLENYLEQTIETWVRALLQAGVGARGAIEITRDSLRGLVLEWKPAPFTVAGYRPGFKWMGMTAASGNYMAVGWTGSYATSALDHELGHLFLLTWRDDGSETALADMASKYGVPA